VKRNSLRVDRHGGMNSVAAELLEPRRLLSGWSTVDQLSGPNDSSVNAIAADRFGNVYAAGT